MINTASFPVQYSEGFYQDVLKRNNTHLNKLAYYKGQCVAAICARVEHEKLYIMTLAVLAAYRGRGIGAQLLESITNYIKDKPIGEIILHVQISNEGALRFYANFGFSQGELVENYYRRIDPPHCFILYKRFDLGRQTDALDQDKLEQNSNGTSGSNACTDNGQGQQDISNLI
jgi:ribosomal protein S18 acetylase RimI-like enzyme